IIKLNKFFDYCFTFPQYLLPQHGLTSLVYRFTRIKIKWIKNLQIRIFIKIFKVDMNEALKENSASFITFNDFFTRQLKPNVREWNEDQTTILSPVDGAVSQLGLIDSQKIIQAKGKSFSLSQLVAHDKALTKKFISGTFSTLYLSPRDYHRIHMPMTGKLLKTIYVPGKLFSVNNSAVRNIDNLFAKNERFISIFESEIGQYALIMIGALFVGSMSTVFTGQITPSKDRRIITTDYTSEESIILKKGEEFGLFNMGSTVILLFEQQKMKWSKELSTDISIRTGQIVGELVA
ncbi:MAG: archaetidylserine decarboxylase, partial [Pseudomonadota bacterium]